MGTISIRETKPATVGGIPQQQNPNGNYNINTNYNNIIQPPQSPSDPMGIQPTGTWMNQHTGEIVTVDNMVNDMSQNGAQVMLSTGELISFSEFSRDYIQVDESDTTADYTGVDDNNTNITENTCSPEFFSLDKPLIGAKQSSCLSGQEETLKYYKDNDILSLPEDSGISKTKQMVVDLIDNLSESRSKKPEVEIDSVIIKNIPREALSSLIKYFNVSVSDIVDVIFEKLIDKNIIKKCITDYIDDVKTKSVRKSSKTEITACNEQSEN